MSSTSRQTLTCLELRRGVRRTSFQVRDWFRISRTASGSRPRCGGSIYLHVLASSLLLTILGLGALAAVRLEMRSARLACDVATARACAVSAVELGLLQVQQNPDWRTTWPDGTWLDNRELGSGRFSLQGTDPVDGSLGDSVYDALVLTGLGMQGPARHQVQVTLTPIIQPLAALNTCLCASGLVQIKAGKWITAIGAPLATNGSINNDGTIDGNAEAQSLGHTGTVTGTLTAPGSFRPMPDATVFADYVRRATAIPYASTIENLVLAPGCNPLGATDPNGFYVIDTSGRDVTLRQCRIYGTLIIRAAGHNVILDDPIFMRNYRADAPVLLVEGNVTLKTNSVVGTLSESTCDTNFNPTGAPYAGVTDLDKTDEYPNEIRGLVHIRGALKLQQTARIVGVVLCEGDVTCEATNTLVHDPALYAQPPQGYTCVERMKIVPGSWQQVVD